jgi:hypothetical protein
MQKKKKVFEHPSIDCIYQHTFVSNTMHTCNCRNGRWSVNPTMCNINYDPVSVNTCIWSYTGMFENFFFFLHEPIYMHDASEKELKVMLTTITSQINKHRWLWLSDLEQK